MRTGLCVGDVFVYEPPVSSCTDGITYHCDAVFYQHECEYIDGCSWSEELNYWETYSEGNSLPTPMCSTEELMGDVLCVTINDILKSYDEAIAPAVVGAEDMITGGSFTAVTEIAKF